MFCPNCGTNNIEISANYCHQCGKKLNLDTKRNRKIKIITYILPLISIIIVSVIMAVTFFFESKINEKVIKYQDMAERAALSGEFDKALSLLDDAISYRNNYNILLEDKKIIQSVVELNDDLHVVEKKIMDEQFETAQKEINLLKRQVDKNQSPLYAKLTHEIEQVESSVKIGEIKEEITKLSSIDQLAEKLSTLYSLELQEASELKQQIYTKMIMLSSTEAEKDLENKHFNQALYQVDAALQYVVNNEKLISLRDRIKEEKKSFEKAQQERIDKAVLAAKQEKQLNLTKAVELTTIEIQVDKFGDAYLNGTVKNKGTETVHSIIVEFVVKDKDGVKLEDGKTNVFPNKLKPGETGEFEHVTYSAKNDAKVEIKKISWLLEEKKG
ncbi:putative nucleic acid-binding Zn ribbon protein [Metabacillus crassostreae]|uniref:FxLYD domain-containing protein n=1 Tax=Metabacillus crassostreae TaxID=929098 RepID=UPI00195C92EB|nr:FxLYD domain-containing protein [Metabacillus crassostreae]MBM7602108.1 putative nucleic acid-binding Zn ribbon protein [Metabacillus crassostreae]